MNFNDYSKPKNYNSEKLELVNDCIREYRKSQD
jgi:hypothetical protein